MYQLTSPKVSWYKEDQEEFDRAHNLLVKMLQLLLTETSCVTSEVGLVAIYLQAYPDGLDITSIRFTYFTGS